MHLQITIVSKGSVVVFGAWSSWTPDYAVYAAAPDDYNYCAYEPMMWAFGILITKWVRRHVYYY